MTQSAKHVLVVEDEKHLAIGIKYNLEAEGHQVTVVGDGPTALKLIEEQPDLVNLVVLDLMLPGMSGYAVCEALRAAGNDVPILMLSARTLAEDRIRGYDLGADQYLQKPFELDELLAMVRNLLARRRRGATGSKTNGDIFEFGQARINFDTYEVTVNGQELRLTPMELKLIRYFRDNEGRVIGRGELLERVWAQPNIETTRTVDNFIVRLRKYFEPDPARPRYFRSVRGAGYRYVSSPEDAEED